MKVPYFILPLATAAFFIFTNISSGGILIGNYPPANDSTFSTIAATSGKLSKAAGFSLPAGSDYLLNSITLRLRVNNASSSVSFALFGDDQGDPTGVPLLTFHTRALIEGVGDYFLLPDQAFELLESETYWIAATGTSPTVDGVTWLAANPGIDPTGIATSAGFRSDSSGSYPPTRVSSIKNTYQVSATIVPEPSTLIFGISLAGALFLHRRRPCETNDRQLSKKV